jgi:hypothetical protein
VSPTIRGNDAAEEPGGVHAIIEADERFRGLTERLDIQGSFSRTGGSVTFRRLTSALLVVLAGGLFVIASTALVGPKDKVAAATMKWAETLGRNDPDACSSSVAIGSLLEVH